MPIKLGVNIEMKGKSIRIGGLVGNTAEDAYFVYDLQNVNAKPISISLPLQKEAFSSERTRIFFDGLLSEGYTRRCVAAEMRVATDDYISILKNLGKECLGAIQIFDENDVPTTVAYEEMTYEQLHMFAKEGAMESATLVTKSHLSLTGASGKAGLYYDKKSDKWYLPLGSAPSTHIVKQSHVRLEQIVANEQLCLLTAKKLGIEVPESFIVNFENNEDSNVLFATRRYDRKIGNEKVQDINIPKRLHQEDFAQALGIASEKKYEKQNEQYLKRMFELVKEHVSNPMHDQMALWRIVVFNYLIGNTDNHIKNLSLLYSEDLSQIGLAPAYDIVSTLIYESSADEMALSINGKNNIYDVTREEVGIVGVDGGGCVALTVMGAIKNGLKVTLHEDAIGTMFQKKKEKYYKKLEKMGV